MVPGVVAAGMLEGSAVLGRPATLLQYPVAVPLQTSAAHLIELVVCWQGVVILAVEDPRAFCPRCCQAYPRATSRILVDPRRILLPLRWPIGSSWHQLIVVDTPLCTNPGLAARLLPPKDQLRRN